MQKLADLLANVTLQPHQQRIVDRISNNPRLLVYHGLGSGKTLSAISAAESAAAPYAAIVPASLRNNFRKELEKFTDQTTPVDVLSYTQVGAGHKPTTAFDTLILDEAHRLRNPESAQAKNVAALAEKARRVLALSGTPIVNRPGDLATILNLIAKKNYTPESFEKRFVRKKRVSPGLFNLLRGIPHGIEERLNRESELRRLLANRVDYQPTKPPEGVVTKDIVVDVPLSRQQQDFLDVLEQDLSWVLRWKLRRQFPLSDAESQRLLAFLTGPRQAALSLLPFTDMSPLQAFYQSAKLQTAAQRLEDALKNPQVKALVFSNFISAGLVPYAAYLSKKQIPFAILHGSMPDKAKQTAVNAYNSGKVRVLLLGPAGSEGISTKGTQLIQLLDPHFNATRSEQARGRGLRFDSHVHLPEELKNVTIERYISHRKPVGFFGRLFNRKNMPTADEILSQMAVRKQKLNEEFLSLLRDVGTKKPATFF